MIPKMWATSLHSKKLATNHFWLGTIGIIIYAVPMYWAGFEQSLMWKAFTPEGQLKFQFLETVTSIKPLYVLRSIGGALYLVGTLLMVYNLAKTIRQGTFIPDEAAEASAGGIGGKRGTSVTGRSGQDERGAGAQLGEFAVDKPVFVRAGWIREFELK